MVQSRTPSQAPSERNLERIDPLFETVVILEADKARRVRSQVQKSKPLRWSLLSCLAPSTAGDAADVQEHDGDNEEDHATASTNAKWTWGTRKVRAEDVPCVMFVGLDGSGKTAIVNTLLEEARRLRTAEQEARDAVRRAKRSGGGGGDGGTATSPPSASGHPGPSKGNSTMASVPASTAGGGDTLGDERASGWRVGDSKAVVAAAGGKGGAKAKCISTPAPAPTDKGMLYHLPEGVLRNECVLMDTPGGYYSRRTYLCGLQLATAVVLTVDAADEERFPVVRQFFLQHVLPEMARRHLPLLLIATKRDVCDWGAAEDVALDLDLAILLAHVAAPWTAAHLVAGELGSLREPMTWLLQQSHIVDHLWHSWPSSAPVLLHYQQANARYAVGMASKKAVEVFRGEEEEQDGGVGGMGSGGGSGGGGGGGGGRGFRVAAGPLPATAASGVVTLSAVPSLMQQSSSVYASVVGP